MEGLMSRRLWWWYGLAASLTSWTFAAQADGEHYMKIESEWQLGKIVKNDDGKEEFVTCPGEMRYALDINNLKPAADTCDGRGGVFGVLKLIEGQGTFAVTRDDGTMEIWTLPDKMKGSEISPGSNVYLEIFDKDKMVAKPYEVMLAPSKELLQ
jgi:hypothetical protein